MTLSNPETQDARGQIFQADVLNDDRTVDLERTNSTRERCVFPRSHGKGARLPALPNFGSSLLLMRTPYVAELPNLTW